MFEFFFIFTLRQLTQYAIFEQHFFKETITVFLIREFRLKIKKKKKQNCKISNRFEI